jgi:hypothetical protein
MNGSSYTAAMAARIGIIAAEERATEAIAAHSRTALDRPLRCDAELAVSVARGDAVLLGAFQRGVGMPQGCTLHRRGSGGPEVVVGGGTVHVALALAHPGAIVKCDEKRIVNRYVRPLLRALTKVLGPGGLAHFFGRDWVSVGKRPAAWVGFAHDAATRRTLFEAFVSVRVPFARVQRDSFLGRPPGALESIVGKELEPSRIASAIVDEYAGAADASSLDAPAMPSPIAGEDLRQDPPWEATVQEAIGALGAGTDAQGRFRVGGDLLVSRDALARLEDVAVTANEEDLGRVVNETLSVPGVALDGVRSLESVREVIARARQARRG